MDFDRLCETTRALAIEAGEAILRVYQGGEMGVRQKADASPVTEADLQADRIIREGLRAAFPGLPVVTEEEAASHAVVASEFVLVDPLDGTREFVERRGDFTVNIAFVRDGEPLRGVVYAPARARLFYTNAVGDAVEEDGTHDASRVGVSMPIRVAPRPDNARLRAVASKSHRDAATDAWLSRHRVADFRAAGSSLKFCLVATGEADLYPRLGRTMEWDTAAGQAVLRGAGGLVARLPDLAPLRYGKPGWENPHFVAYAPGVELRP